MSKIVELDKLHFKVHESGYNLDMRPHQMLKDLLTPSSVSGFFSVLATLVILFSSSLYSLIYNFTDPNTQYYVNKLLHAYTDTIFSRIGQTQILGQATVFLLWAGAGAVVYIIIWLIISSYIAVHNDVVIGTTYTSIETHGHAKYWAEVSGRGLFRLSAVLVFLLIASLTLQVWYPLSVTMFRIWATNLSVPVDWAFLVETLTGWFLAFHLLVVFLRLAFLRTRVFS